MRHFCMTGIICGCLLIGSIYPKMILQHHLRLVDQNGREMKVEEAIDAELPVEIQFRFLQFFR